MKWTKKKPTQLGYYWLRYKTYSPQIVEVYRCKPIGFSSTGCTYSYGEKECRGCEWYGPLTPPK